MKLINGFKSYAPTMAKQNTGFDKKSYEFLFKLEEKNFWFKSRNRLIIYFIGKYFGNKGLFLEIGCGTGFVLQGIKENFSQIKCHGSEIYTKGLKFSQKRVPDSELFQMDARNIPFKNKYNLVGAFDVIEHIEEDEIVLRQIYKTLKKSGVVTITVPQHQFLWSKIDEFAFHKRRYNKKDLINKLQKSGFKIIRATSFVSVLLPFMFISRFINKQNTFDPVKEFQINFILNKIFEWCLAIERVLIKVGFNFPFGGSLIIAAKKK